MKNKLKKIITFITIACFVTILCEEIDVNAEGESEQLIIVNKSKNRLAFYEDGLLVKEFDVATGRQAGFTPEGDYNVIVKWRYPVYYKYNIPGGDPRNPLGNRWLGIDVPGTNGYTYGIHGNSDESSIGTYASAGCVRMHDWDIEWMFEYIDYGARVLILKSDQTFDEIARDYEYPLKEIEEKNEKITLLYDTSLFESPHIFSYSNQTISKQTVERTAVYKHWSRIKVEEEDYWIASKNILIGELKEEKKYIYTKGVNPVYSKPMEKEREGKVIQRGVYEVKRYTKEWYEIIDPETKEKVWLKPNHFNLSKYKEELKKEMEETDQKFAKLKKAKSCEEEPRWMRELKWFFTGKWI